LFSIFVAIVMMATISCASKRSQNLYGELDGESKIAEIVDNFIEEIAFYKPTYEFFKDSNMSRFKEKLSEQLCVLADGPCTYTGDTMSQVHTGMNISESEFNHGVDLFIIAMEKASVPHNLQNSLLKEMAKTRSQMIYR
jgi:hemoglobin